MHSILKVALTSWTRTFLIAMRKCTQFSSLHSFLSFAPTSRTRTRTHISNLLNLRKYTHFSNSDFSITYSNALTLFLIPYSKCTHFSNLHSLLNLEFFQLPIQMHSIFEIPLIILFFALTSRTRTHFSNLHSINSLYKMNPHFEHSIIMHSLLNLHSFFADLFKIISKSILI